MTTNATRLEMRARILNMTTLEPVEVYGYMVALYKAYAQHRAYFMVKLNRHTHRCFYFRDDELIHERAHRIPFYREAVDALLDFLETCTIPQEKLQCEWCGKSFVPYHCLRTYCSDECQYEGYKDHINTRNAARRLVEDAS